MFALAGFAKPAAVLVLPSNSSERLKGLSTLIAQSSVGKMSKIMEMPII